MKSIKKVIVKAAKEVLGVRKKRRKKRGLYIWNEDLKNALQKKKELQLKHLSDKNRRIKQCRQDWANRMQRMYQDGLPKKLMF